MEVYVMRDTVKNENVNVPKQEGAHLQFSNKQEIFLIQIQTILAENTFKKLN